MGLLHVLVSACTTMSQVLVEYLHGDPPERTQRHTYVTTFHNPAPTGVSPEMTLANLHDHLGRASTIRPMLSQESLADLRARLRDTPAIGHMPEFDDAAFADLRAHFPGLIRDTHTGVLFSEPPPLDLWYHLQLLTLADGAAAYPEGNDLRDHSEDLSAEDSAAVASTSEQTLDHAMAMLFIKLGPPPEPTENKYAPASNGGGGAEQ